MNTLPDQFTIRVTPKAAANRIKIEDDGAIRVYVTTAPEDGKANKKVIELLSKEFKIPKSSLEIIKGHKNKDKLIAVQK